MISASPMLIGVDGECEMSCSKRTPQGILQRRAALAEHGLPETLLAMNPPRGTTIDDLLDACACLLIAERISEGTAQSFP